MRPQIVNRSRIRLDLTIMDSDMSYNRHKCDFRDCDNEAQIETVIGDKGSNTVCTPCLFKLVQKGEKLQYAEVMNIVD